MLDENLRSTAEAEGIEKFVIGAVVHDAGKTLLVTRSLEDDFLPGLEEVPSGGVESLETLDQALHRELDEEVGFGAEYLDEGFVAEFDYQSRSGKKSRQYTVSVPLRGREVRLSDEHTSSRWITTDELNAANATAETKDVLRQWFAWTSDVG